MTLSSTLPSSTPPPAVKLTPRQRAFINAYLANGFNATKAAIAAKYSEATAYSQGSRLLKNVEIKAEIDAYFDEATMGPKEALWRVTRHARGDIGDVWDEAEGRVDWAKARAEGKTDLIKKVKRKTRREISFDDDGKKTVIETVEEEVEFYDAQAAQALLVRVHGLFVDRTEHTGKDGGPIILKTGMSLDDL